MSAELNVTEAPAARMDADSGDTGDHYESDSNDSGGGDSGDAGGDFDENGQRTTHGLGQSKSSRRRRRKRKNKAAGGEAGSAPAGAAPAGEDAVMAAVSQPMPVLPGESLALANGNGQQRERFQNNGGQNGGGQVRSMQGNGQGNAPSGGQFGGQGQSAAAQNGQPGADGTKRWKKKFRERTRGAAPNGQPQQGSFQPQGGFQAQGGFERQGNGGSNGFRQQEFRGPDTHQPGNNAGGGGKRKGGFGQGGGGKQQRSGGPRSFVGPMDHSYRAVNGNVFDPSAPGDGFMNANGNGRGRSSGGYHGDAQPIDYSQGRAIPIAPDAPTKIYFFIEDLFFTAKIQETARKLGIKVAFIKNEKEQIAALTSGEEEDRPGLIVFDLNNANAKPLTLIPKLKTKLKKHTSIVGFLSHLQGDLKAKAVEAGCDSVMPRAAFSQNLPNLLRRYGLEEVEEPNYNQ